jgi:hypothetical protein
VTEQQVKYDGKQYLQDIFAEISLLDVSFDTDEARSKLEELVVKILNVERNETLYETLNTTMQNLEMSIMPSPDVGDYEAIWTMLADEIKAKITWCKQCTGDGSIVTRNVDSSKSVTCPLCSGTGRPKLQNVWNEPDTSFEGLLAYLASGVKFEFHENDEVIYFDTVDNEFRVGKIEFFTVVLKSILPYQEGSRTIVYWVSDCEYHGRGGKFSTEQIMPVNPEIIEQYVALEKVRKQSRSEAEQAAKEFKAFENDLKDKLKLYRKVTV